MNKFMEIAIGEAKRAYLRGEVPIGAVIEKNGKVVAKAFNKREKTQNATNHAELLAIKKACKKLHSWRLDDCTIYVTLEPCPMCAGAILNARIPNVVYGAKSSLSGACGSACDLFNKNILNHQAKVECINEPACSELLKSFFKSKRK